MWKCRLRTRYALCSLLVSDGCNLLILNAAEKNSCSHLLSLSSTTGSVTEFLLELFLSFSLVFESLLFCGLFDEELFLLSFFSGYVLRNPQASLSSFN